MKTDQDQVTRNLLQFCYHCEDAHLCTTEEACKACWAENGWFEPEAEAAGAEETRQLLQFYYA
ncbi:hypothetical protein [Paenibacillus woosongensis]|uniref:Uncharacterized protein n=1 Tax=Paenibacillus woosongensis TaxID=307580 RepID=A0A7X3CQV1_9BACL|nr:hypothetical protein [Paenibacillus woosongensis]MUG47490.1 hypothetical protein [Paenibacillus woosongensis]